MTLTFWSYLVGPPMTVPVLCSKQFCLDLKPKKGRRELCGGSAPSGGVNWGLVQRDRVFSFDSPNIINGNGTFDALWRYVEGLIDLKNRSAGFQSLL